MSSLTLEQLSIFDSNLFFYIAAYDCNISVQSWSSHEYLVSTMGIGGLVL